MVYRIHTMVLLDELLYNYVSSHVTCIYRIYIVYRMYIVIAYYTIYRPIYSCQSKERETQVSEMSLPIYVSVQRFA